MNRNESASRAVIARGTGLGIALGLVANLTIYLVGNAGAPIEVVTGWAPDGAPITILEIVLTASVWIGLGGGLLWLWSRRRADPIAPWTVVAALIAVGSAIPLWRLDVDTGSKVGLTLMHLVTGAAAVAGHLLSRRGRGSTTHRPTGPVAG